MQDVLKMICISEYKYQMANQNTEPLLQENPNRFVMFPIKHHKIWEAFQTHRKTYWVESEVDLSGDLKDWRKLTDDERHFIKNILAFFAASDGIVLENLGLRFFSEVQIPEARCFYAFQMAMECVHGLMYSRLIDTYIEDKKEQARLFQATSTIPSIEKKADWAQKWISDESSDFATRLVAFAAVEGIFFSGSFCSIYWLKERGVLPGLCESNDFISRDEGLHTDFAVLLYLMLKNKLTDKQIHMIISGAVEVETEFIVDSLKVSVLGMNSGLMIEYIKFCANRLVLQLGHSPLYPDAKQPFDFMDRICLENKTNFFEQRVTEYRRDVGDNKDDEFEEVEDF